MGKRKRSARRGPSGGLHNIQGPVGDRLRRNQRKREQNLKELRTTFALALAACNEAVTWFGWMDTLCRNKALSSLLERIQLDVHRGLEAALAGDYPTVNDIGRDLMEIEALLRDFTREPSQLQKWAESADDHAQARAFSFGKITDRLRHAAGLSQDDFLPDKQEYMAHSDSLHPTPRGHGPGALGSSDSVLQLEHDLSDLLMHVGRTYAATIQMAETTGLFETPEGEPPPEDALNAVLDVLAAKAEIIDAALQEAGLEMRPRGPSKRGESFIVARPRAE